MVRRLQMVAIGAVVCGLAGPGWGATPADEAEALIDKGNELRRNRDDQSAFPLFQKAYELKPGPRTAVQLGLVEQALGRWADADEHLTEGLRASNDPWIKKNRAIIDESVRKVKVHVARVEITGEPADAEVLVNGRTVGKVPLDRPVRVAEGSVDIELRAAGYKRGFRTVTVRGGQYQPVVIRLEREGVAPGLTPAAATLPAPAGPRGNVPVTGPLLATPSPTSADVAASAGEAEGPHWRPWALGGAAAGAVVGVGLGVFEMLQHDRKVKEFNDRTCLETPRGVVRKPATPDDGCVDLNTDYRNARTLSVVGFAAGGALAVTALVLYLTTPDGAPVETAAAAAPITCTPDLRHAGVSCLARF
jgi:hypothetical protein